MYRKFIESKAGLVVGILSAIIVGDFLVGSFISFMSGDGPPMVSMRIIQSVSR